MLQLERVSVSYGHVAALRDCSLEVAKGTIVTLLGANGAGKTTTLHAIAGFAPVRNGKVTLDGRDVTALAPDAIVRAGISLVAEHRQLFPAMTVEENLRMGCFVHGFGSASTRQIDDAYTLFPALVEKRRVAAGMLSGGQQQMLAIGRALMARPRYLLLDEPSLGLAPMLVDRIFAAISAINADGVSVLLVEQNAFRTLPISSHAYVLETGRIVMAGNSKDLAHDPRIRESYLGTL